MRNLSQVSHKELKEIRDATSFAGSINVFRQSRICVAKRPCLLFYPLFRFSAWMKGTAWPWLRRACESYLLAFVSCRISCPGHRCVVEGRLQYEGHRAPKKWRAGSRYLSALEIHAWNPKTDCWSRNQSRRQILESCCRLLKFHQSSAIPCLQLPSLPLSCLCSVAQFRTFAQAVHICRQAFSWFFRQKLYPFPDNGL